MAGGVEGKIDVDRVGKAVDALLRWVSNSRENQSIPLLDDEQLLYLNISLKKIPEKARVNPFKLHLPHPLVDDNPEICLIVDDLSRGLLRKEAKQRVLEEGLRVSKVLGISKLKKDYRTSEAKRKLCGSYDLFLVDRRVLSLLPKVLGKVFFRKKKTPIPVDLTKNSWKNQVENVCNSTFLFISTGTCSVVRVAKVSQTREEIVENVMAVIEGVAAKVPNKWENILALHLKSLESLALPIYQATPSYPHKIDVNLNSGKKLKKKGGELQKNVTRVKLPEVEEDAPEPELASEKKIAKNILKKTKTKEGSASRKKALGSKNQ